MCRLMDVFCLMLCAADCAADQYSALRANGNSLSEDDSIGQEHNWTLGSLGYNDLGIIDCRHLYNAQASAPTQPVRFFFPLPDVELNKGGPVRELAKSGGLLRERERQAALFHTGPDRASSQRQQHIPQQHIPVGPQSCQLEEDLEDTLLAAAGYCRPTADGRRLVVDAGASFPHFFFCFY